MIDVEVSSGQIAKAEVRSGDRMLAGEAVRLAESCDGLNRRAKAHSDLGEVLQRAARINHADVAFDRAIELYEQKGNVVGAARTRALREGLVVV